MGITADASLHPFNDVRTGCLELARDEPGGCPLTGQVASGMEVT